MGCLDSVCEETTEDGSSDCREEEADCEVMEDAESEAACCCCCGSSAAGLDGASTFSQSSSSNSEEEEADWEAATAGRALAAFSAAM